MSTTTLLIIILIILLAGGFFGYRTYPNYGYHIGGLIGLAIIVFLVLVLLGKVSLG